MAGRYSLTVPFFNAASAANGRLGRVGFRRRSRERNVRFARIGIDAKDQELGCQHAEIDAVAGQRLGFVGGAKFHLPFRIRRVLAWR